MNLTSKSFIIARQKQPYWRSHRELALSWRRDGKTYEQIEALFGGNPWETVQRSEAMGVCKYLLVGWATGLPLSNGTLSADPELRAEHRFVQLQAITAEMCVFVDEVGVVRM